MFYRFYILSDRFDHGPCTSFEDPIAKSDIFSCESLAGVYHKLALFLNGFLQDEAPLEVSPDVVYVVFGEDPKLCPYRSSNSRQLLFGFDRHGKPYRTLGCEHL